MPTPTCRFLHMDSHLLAIAEGDHTHQTWLEMFRKLANHAVEHGYDCALLDARQIAGPTNDTQRFELGMQAVACFRGKVRVTVVAPIETISGFGETVAVNRGALIKVTHDYNAAMRWLLHDAIHRSAVDKHLQNPPHRFASDIDNADEQPNKAIKEWVIAVQPELN